MELGKKVRCGNAKKHVWTSVKDELPKENIYVYCKSIYQDSYCQDPHPIYSVGYMLNGKWMGVNMKPDYWKEIEE